MGLILTKINLKVGAKDDLGHPLQGIDFFVFRISQMAFPHFDIQPSDSG
jgi:hypothetical protein